ncbi:hypothetical protein [Celeribacter sp. PS-C1]|uniref:hypothetical protein n=1 Tax=Celeribacter sp. PS-C1 TaxID=2820813 RepID=UPI001CA536F0|nr:hypothetical protein [Celeribacter sp. PS-C1]MBW6419639.1 hypothetical protein [Celeribacter sp. PS-C1]
MFKLKTFAIPSNPASDFCFLNIVLEALEQKDLIPAETPDLGLGDYHVRENLDHLTVEKISGGWVANIIFKPRDGKQMDCMTTSMLHPFPNATEALLFGATVVCEIVTGSSDLPFSVAGNKLIMASYGKTA